MSVPPDTSPAAALADVPTPLAQTSQRWARRALQSLGVGVIVAIFLSVTYQQRFWSTLLYSECISICCWFFIDGGRSLAALYVNRHGAAEQRRNPALKEGWPGWHWMALCVLVGTAAGITLGTGLAEWILGVDTRHEHSGLNGVVTLLLISLVPAIATTYFFWSRGQMQATQARAEAAQRQAAENQLRLLESQLEPHMLFNTLANLRVLIGLDPARAQLMLDRLIGFLRATLSASRVNLHPLSLEFERVADYLALMKVRMGDRLQEELLLPAALARQPVPPLLLQPLVENAIKHGLEPHVDGGRLEVTAAVEGGQLVLKVRDTGAGLTSSAGTPEAVGTGFGLQQVRDRLATLYGARASFTLEAAPASDQEGGSLATVRLPFTPNPPADKPPERPTPR